MEAIEHTHTVRQSQQSGETVTRVPVLGRV